MCVNAAKTCTSLQKPLQTFPSFEPSCLTFLFSVQKDSGQTKRCFCRLLNAVCAYCTEVTMLFAFRSPRTANFVVVSFYLHLICAGQQLYLHVQSRCPFFVICVVVKTRKRQRTLPRETRVRQSENETARGYQRETARRCTSLRNLDRIITAER